MVFKPRSKPRFSPQRTLDDPALECLESFSPPVSHPSGNLSLPLVRRTPRPRIVYPMGV